MGVRGLWEVLAPAGTSVSLHKLALDAFEKNASGKRAYRIGIDASLWLRHAAMVKEGDNPELRTLFFRVKELAKLPILPLFVFDGRSRHEVNRGIRLGKSGAHNLTADFKELLDAFGMYWCEAEGEAEAELAYLNRAGVIDAVMTDDADCFVFGAVTVIKNQSQHLTDNRSNPAIDMEGNASKHHVIVYNACDIASHPEIGLSQGGFILFALLTGGDYDKGVDKIGKATAHALARAGFGDELLRAIHNRENVSLHTFLPAWRDRINLEFRTNVSGVLGRTSEGLMLPPTFPNLHVLEKYANPARRVGSIQGVWTDKEMNLPQIAAFCEKHFEWGTREIIIRRFRTLIWEGCISRVLRRAALAQDAKEPEQMQKSGVHASGSRARHRPRPNKVSAVGTKMSMITKYLNANAAQSRMDRISAAFVNRGSSTHASDDVSGYNNSPSFITKLHSERRHVSTDRSLEYRIEVDPAALVTLTRSGIKGTRPEPSSPMRKSLMDDSADEDDRGTVRRKSQTAKAHPEPNSSLRMWCPAQMLCHVNPAIVREFEERKNGKKRGSANAQRNHGSPPVGSQTGRQRQRKGKRKEAPVDSESELDDFFLSTPSLGTQKNVGRDKVRRRLFIKDCPAPSAKTFSHGVEALVSKASHSSAPSTACRIRYSASKREMSTADFNRSLRPLDVALKAARLKRHNTMTLPVLNGTSSTSTSRASEPGPSSSQPLTSTTIRTANADSDDTSLFLYHLPDPCNPRDLEVQRHGDLRMLPFDATMKLTLTELSSVNDDNGVDSDNVSLSDGERELDKILHRNFVAKAKQTNASYKPRPRKNGLPVPSQYAHQPRFEPDYTEDPPQRRSPSPGSESSSDSDDYYGLQEFAYSSSPYLSDCYDDNGQDDSESEQTTRKSTMPTDVIELSSDDDDAVTITTSSSTRVPEVSSSQTLVNLSSLVGYSSDSDNTLIDLDSD